jgi:hypothetical protein
MSKVMPGLALRVCEPGARVRMEVSAQDPPRRPRPATSQRQMRTVLVAVLVLFAEQDLGNRMATREQIQTYLAETCGE